MSATPDRGSMADRGIFRGIRKSGGGSESRSREAVWDGLKTSSSGCCSRFNGRSGFRGIWRPHGVFKPKEQFTAFRKGVGLSKGLVHPSMRNARGKRHAMLIFERRSFFVQGLSKWMCVRPLPPRHDIGVV